MVSWDPPVYARFASRARAARSPTCSPGSVPARPRPGRSTWAAADGDLTASLARRWPAAEVVGIDSSEQMLARAPDQADRGGRRRAG